MSHESRSLEKLEDRILMTQLVGLPGAPAPGMAVYGPITAPTNGAAPLITTPLFTALTPTTTKLSFAPPVVPNAAVFTPEAANQPIGVAQGINAGRVTWVHNAAAVNSSWDLNNSATGYWWEDRNNNQSVLNDMVGQTVRWLTGQSTDAAAWDALFRSFNVGRGAGNVGYTPGQKICVKVNLNNTWNFNIDKNDPAQYQMGVNNWADGSPQSIYALIYQLKNAGVREQDIYFIEPGRYFVDRLFNPLHAAFPAVHFVDRIGINGREKALRTADPVIHFANGKEAYIPQLYVDSTYLINLAPLKKHEAAGFTCVGKNQYGAVWTTDNTGGIEWSPASVHTTLASNLTQTGRYSEMADINGSPEIGGKTMLYMIDALWGGWNSNGASSCPLPYDMAPFYGNYPASMFASQDFVAIESVALDFIRTEDALHTPPRGLGAPVTANADNTLHESALANSSGTGLPAGIAYSGTVYKPDGTHLLASLGTHEHWNSASARQYSRNLGTGAGIELVTNQAPTNLALSRTQIPDNLPVGAAVGTLSTTDYNAASSFTYSLVPGANSADNASFTISNSQLLTAVPLSYPTKSTYAIRLRSTDPFGFYFEKAFTITVTSSPAAPSGLAAKAFSSSQINLTWVDNSSNETGFQIDRATDPGFTQNVVSVTAPANATSYAVTGLALNTLYYFRIAAMGSSISPFATAIHAMLRMGDATLDGQVDLTDLTVLASNWQQSGKTFADGDSNGDGTVDLTDLTILASQWQTPAPAPAPASDPPAAAPLPMASAEVMPAASASQPADPAVLPVASDPVSPVVAGVAFAARRRR